MRLLKKKAKVSKEKSKEQEVDPLLSEELDQEEFDSFFSEVLKKIPQKTSKVILNTYEKSKKVAETILEKNQVKFDHVFEDFLKGVDSITRKKSHRIIHAASLTAAIIGCSPIPFSDAFLVVPVQLTMMARLHKLFGQPWSESLGKSLSKELVVVSLGRSAVGNLMKFVPAVGTVTGAAINATVASAITESLGWVTVKMLNDGEDIFEQVMSFKGQFQTLFRALKTVSKK
ncbi:YcjF family protein [Enterococcus durans]|uniref:YcjF family protein n=1 Tax=Enterococcus durans TaxID=53345 RepID=UPI001C8B8FE4|nr:YcjF family protein [Enterococcus durans]MBX9039683.1 YcjF family protein [Enterococcus durans]MBX9076803.1 YcjF family protein [Enterococcus durans]